MANEVTIWSSLHMRKGAIDYPSRPLTFSADVTGTKGPTPGSFTASTAGTDVDLSELTTPGWAILRNLDVANYVTYGIWDPETVTFYPLGELLAGEHTVLRLARDVSSEYGTGAGTTGPNTNTLRFKANTAACIVSVEAFEK